jgi:hypothetical protein
MGGSKGEKYFGRAQPWAEQAMGQEPLQELQGEVCVDFALAMGGKRRWFFTCWDPIGGTRYWGAGLELAARQTTRPQAWDPSPDSDRPRQGVQTAWGE